MKCNNVVWTKIQKDSEFHSLKLHSTKLKQTSEIIIKKKNIEDTISILQA